MVLGIIVFRFKYVYPTIFLLSKSSESQDLIDQDQGQVAAQKRGLIFEDQDSSNVAAGLIAELFLAFIFQGKYILAHTAQAFLQGRCNLLGPGNPDDVPAAVSISG